MHTFESFTMFFFFDLLNAILRNNRVPTNSYSEVRQISQSRTNLAKSDKSRKVGQIPKVGQITICCSVLRALLSLASIAESCKDC